MHENSHQTWEQYFKKFHAGLSAVSKNYDTNTIFGDVCRIFSLSLRGACTIDPTEKKEIEEEYQRFVEKYGSEGMQQCSTLFNYVVQALEIRRSDFLGHVYEALNATKKCWGQFFTPDSVSQFMSHVILGDQTSEPGKITSLNDPTCGAGALLIEAAESFCLNGGRQSDLIIYAEDIDPVAVCIVYVQLTLLGYAAVVRRMDSLSLQVYEGPWFTFGYFAHAMPMRGLDWNKPLQPRDTTADGEPNMSDNAINIRGCLEQAELNF